ncbi:MAG: GntR family transcriptional regulator [Lentisphaeria bacterium]|nr:GntR family transcriptional regulator [Lentisphaeria bacterium]
MTQFHKTLPRKVEFARDALVTLIHDRKMNSGDRLPAYSVLREDLGLGSQTIAGAVNLLSEAGVLEVRDKVGIFVKDPDGGLLTGRTIAVAVRPIEGSAYGATLCAFIQKILSERNCRCLTFFRSSQKTAGAELSEFPGLEQAVLEHRCDGVITLCPFSPRAVDAMKKQGIRCCFVGDDDLEVLDFGVVIEVGRFIGSAVRGLRKAGCRRIIQFAVSEDQLRSRSAGNVPGMIGVSYEGGAAIAGKLLAMKPDERPDGIISDDDIVVSGFLAQLFSSQLPDVRYLPMIATIIHRELGERYPSDRMLLYEQSIGEYAGLAVDLLLAALRGKEVPGSRIVYRFRPVMKA